MRFVGSARDSRTVWSTHAHGILHNDLKPANVLLTDDGQPMLLDFGVSEDLKVRATAPGATVGGTLPYMSPEHLRSVRDRTPATDARSDVYALGIILFELLTGESPFRQPDGELEEEVPRMLAEREQPAATASGVQRAGFPRSGGGSSASAWSRIRTGGISPRRTCGRISTCTAQQPAAPTRPGADPRTGPEVGASAPPNQFALEPGCRDRLGSERLLVRSVRSQCTRAERAEAVETARQFDDDLKAAHYLLASRTPDPVTVDEGVATCRTALARYGLPEDEAWERAARLPRLCRRASG